MPCLVRQTKVSVKSRDKDGVENGSGLQLPLAEFPPTETCHHIKENDLGSGNLYGSHHCASGDLLDMLELKQ